MVLTKAIDKGELRYLIKTDAYRDWNAKFFLTIITERGLYDLFRIRIHNAFSN